MSSLKAGFISRRRTDLLILILLIISLPLYSSEYRVGIYSDDESALSLMTDALSAFGIYADGSYAESSVRFRIGLSERRSYLRALDGAYQKEGNPESVKQESKEISLPLEIRIMEQDPEDNEKQFLLSASKEAAEYYKLKNELDLLIVLRCDRSDSVPHLYLYINGEIQRESLYTSRLRENEEEALIEVLLPYFRGGNYGIYRLSYPDGAEVLADGERIDTSSHFAVLEKGRHLFSVSAPYHEPGEFMIELGNQKDIVFDLSETEAEPLFITPWPYNAELRYQGRLLESHLISDSRAPFSVTASYPGFALYSFETRKPLNKLSFSMKPVWMESEDVLGKEKGEFYAALFSALVSFGASVGTGTLQRIYSEHDFRPFDVVFTGVSLVSLVCMADSLFSYFEAARYGL